jgi:hypothetical protein
MLPKRRNEDEKDKPENWCPITLTNIFLELIWKDIRILPADSQKENDRWKWNCL